jgi:hypothetical protein
VAAQPAEEELSGPRAGGGRRAGPARHPLDPLDAGEISLAAEILRRAGG